MKKAIILIILSLSLILSGCTSSKKSPSSETKNKETASSTNDSSKEVSSSGENLDVANKEIVPIVLKDNGDSPSNFFTSEKFYYIYNKKENNRIYKYAENNLGGLNDFSKSEELKDCYGSSLIVLGDKLIFSNQNDGNKLYSLSISTGELNKINNYNTISYCQFLDGVAYINRTDKNKLYYTSFIENTTKALTTDSVGKYMLWPNYILYQNADDHFKLYALSIDGKTKTKLTDFATESFVVANNKVYCNNLSENNNIYSINLENQKPKRLEDVFGENISISNDKVVFINKLDNNTVYSMTTDDKPKLNKILDAPVNEFSIVGNMMFYEDPMNVSIINHKKLSK
ncbi:DUF5050 domain-containing protein [Clostridium fallax]|uniref:Prolow-density lipoprotein receptor-related protein 1-like beta-propeller domain-containing protein n=1 Tax=Clostridium fallax TaxID=1533 RepID=A0A1M4TG16_9CLOT|nr:DUF5050 domain-containing protein [Clostridium fallax]SHE43386.1 protein of unknown function [Clostridium fallax]SQB22742.1 basic protein [Clostridium fallax]